MASRRPLILVPGVGSLATFLELPNGDVLELGGDLDLSGNSLQRVANVYDTGGLLLLGFTATALAVNYLQLQNAITGTAPRFTFNGSDTNVSGVFATKGTGRVFCRYSGTNYEIACIDLAQVFTNKTLAAGSGNTIDAALLTSGTVPILRIPLGSSSSTVCVGDDSRLSDARTPTAHASSHQNGGADEVATATAAANAIPKATSGGKLAVGWSPTRNLHDYAKAGTTNFTAYYCAGLASGVALTTLALVANRIYAVPFTAPDRGATIDELEVYVTTGAGSTNVRIGIYENLSATGLYPGTLLLDAGAFTSTTNSEKRTASISQALTPGALYWLVVVSDGAPTIRAGSTNQASPILGTASSANTTYTTHLYATLTYGTLPGTFPTSGATAATAAFPGLFYRLSA